MEAEIRFAEQFTSPAWWSLGATFLYSVVGTTRAIRKGYDIVGVFVVSFVACTGGGVLRDIILQQGPPVILQDSRYLLVAWVAAIVGILLHRSLPSVQPIINVLDAVSIGMFGVVGAQKTILAGFSTLPAILVGFLSALGGGILLSILLREETEIFRPSTFYAVAVLSGLVTFVVLVIPAEVHANIAAFIAIGVTLAVRLMAQRFNWRTRRLN